MSYLLYFWITFGCVYSSTHIFWWISLLWKIVITWKMDLSENLPLILVVGMEFAPLVEEAFLYNSLPDF